MMRDQITRFLMCRQIHCPWCTTIQAAVRSEVIIKIKVFCKSTARFFDSFQANTEFPIQYVTAKPNDPSMSSSQMLEQGIIGAGKSVYNAGIGFARTVLQIAPSSIFGGALPLPNDQLTSLSYSNSTQRVGGITVDTAMLLVGGIGMVEAGVEILAARMGSRASQMGDVWGSGG